MSETIKPGDVVALKSGGPHMTAVSTDDPVPERTRCVFFPAIDMGDAHEMKEIDVPTCALVVIKSSDG